jgi:hypothetical protein
VAAAQQGTKWLTGVVMLCAVLKSGGSGLPQIINSAEARSAIAECKQGGFPQSENGTGASCSNRQRCSVDRGAVKYVMGREI